MYWYNPTTCTMEEDASAPVVDTQAIEMLSGHPESDEFIEEYRRWRQSCGIVEALQRTVDTFRMRHREEE
jgi:hypothetical protein